MTGGAKLFRFECAPACGQCCRDFRVAVTDSDVRRLSSGLGEGESIQPHLEWLSGGDVDMSGEPETFVELPEGRRLLVLRHHAGACSLLHQARCSSYATRPRACRLYPWDVTLGRRGGVRRLELLQDYPPCLGTLEGPRVPPQHIAEQKRLERFELTQYVKTVGVWNRAQWRRRRLGKPLLPGTSFLSQLLVGPIPQTISRARRPGRVG